MAGYYTDLKQRIEAGELRDPDASQEARTVEITDCACGGLGWYLPHTSNQVSSPAVACVCTRRDTQARHRQMCLDNCRIDAETAKRLSFETWAMVLNPDCGVAFNMAKQFAERPARWLVFQGLSGLGKTHLTIAAVYALAEQGVGAEYWRIQDLVSALHEAVAEQALSVFIHDLTKLPVLALDDYGASYMKAFGELEIEGVLDARYLHRSPTLLTTNQAFGDFSPRLRSRLTDPSVVDVVELAGDDVRPRLDDKTSHPCVA